MQTEVIQAGAIQGKRGINSAVLKNIAVVTMLIDHIGAVIMTRLLIRNGLYEAMVNQEAYTAWMGQNGGMYGHLHGNAYHRQTCISDLLFFTGRGIPKDSQCEKVSGQDVFICTDFGGTL